MPLLKLNTTRNIVTSYLAKAERKWKHQQL